MRWPVRVALLLLVLLCGCPSKPHTILSDRPQPPGSYRYAAVGVDSPLSRTIESMVPRQDVVARHADGGEVAYVVREQPESKELFAKVAFKRLENARLEVHLVRVSDINGWGVEVNGEVHSDDTRVQDFTPASMPEAFMMLQRLTANPWGTLRETAPELVGRVASRRPVNTLERGFVLDVEVQLITGNPFDPETHVVLYGLVARSAYFDAESDATGDVLAGAP